jgi:hypothetical protein
MSVSDYIKAGTDALVFLKTLIPLLPTKNRGEAEAKIQTAQDALDRANVDLAKTWGFKLCKCTFPPQIMLWKKEQQTNVCPGCGDINPHPPAVVTDDYEDPWIASRR